MDAKIVNQIINDKSNSIDKHREYYHLDKFKNVYSKHYIGLISIDAKNPKDIRGLSDIKSVNSNKGSLFLSIIYPNGRTHCNVLIINKHNKTIWRYDPSLVKSKITISQDIYINISMDECLRNVLEPIFNCVYKGLYDGTSPIQKNDLLCNEYCVLYAMYRMNGKNHINSIEMMSSMPLDILLKELEQCYI